MIYILEDDDERVRQFRAAAALVAPDLTVRVWRSAHAMIADLATTLEQASIISLDHDLNPFPGDPADPGSGYDVVKYLITRKPSCPVVIHTSNVERGTWMVGELSMSQWRYERVYPYGERWIEEDWLPVLRAQMGR